MKYTTHLLACALLLAGGPAFAHETAAHPASRKPATALLQVTPFGQEGNPKKVDRTVRVSMNDRMRFEPESVTIRKGETVRFAIANKGEVLHEMVLGTIQALREHAELMKKHPGMEHDEPGMAHVKPGATGEIVWQFTQAGEFQFACLLPGHFEAGMVGKVVVK